MEKLTGEHERMNVPTTIPCIIEKPAVFLHYPTKLTIPTHPIESTYFGENLISQARQPVADATAAVGRKLTQNSIFSLPVPPT